MGKKIKSGIGKIFSKLFQILGITSLLTAFGCEESTLPAYGMPSREPDDPFIDTPVEYGCPTNYYTVDGTVRDSKGNAVKGIRVGVKKSPDDETKYYEWDYAEYSSWEDEDGYTHYNRSDYFAFTQTDKDGKYELIWDLWPQENAKFVLYAEDIDGEENGLFKDKAADIQFTDADQTSNDTWVDNYEKKDQDISLEEDDTELSEQ